MREILKDIREVAAQEDPPRPGDRASRRSGRHERHERLVNVPWDSARLGKRRGSRREPDSAGAAPRGRL